MNDREKYQAQHIIDHILYNCSLSSLKERGIINDFDIKTIDTDDSMICNIYVNPNTGYLKKQRIKLNIKINFEIDA